MDLPEEALKFYFQIAINLGIDTGGLIKMLKNYFK
jgi:hypothetical protein